MSSFSCNINRIKEHIPSIEDSMSAEQFVGLVVDHLDETKEAYENLKEGIVKSSEIKPSQRFDESIATLTQERGKSYGHPSTNFSNIAKLKQVVSQCKDPELRHAMEMVCVKLARLIETPDHFDSWLDIAGYSRVAMVILDARADEEIKNVDKLADRIQTNLKPGDFICHDG